MAQQLARASRWRYDLTVSSWTGLVKPGNCRMPGSGNCGSALESGVIADSAGFGCGSISILASGC